MENFAARKQHPCTPSILQQTAHAVTEGNAWAEDGHTVFIFKKIRLKQFAIEIRV